MSKNLSIDNGTNTAQPASWEDAIREAQRMIAEAQDRIKGLKLSLVEFRRRAVPEAVEGIGYRMPGYKLRGKPIVYFAGFKEHYSLSAASGTFFAALEDDLRGYELRTGTVHFPLTKPVPVKLISRTQRARGTSVVASVARLRWCVRAHTVRQG